MTVEQKDVIDIISKNKEGEFVLTISDHVDWSNLRAHLTLLQDKINTYLEFLESGEIYEKYPDAKDHPLVIEVMFHYPLHPQAKLFLDKVQVRVKSLGFCFRHRLFAATPFPI